MFDHLLAGEFHKCNALLLVKMMAVIDEDPLAFNVSNPVNVSDGIRVSTMNSCEVVEASAKPKRKCSITEANVSKYLVAS